VWTNGEYSQGQPGVPAPPGGCFIIVVTQDQ
jgi:hypothetical protein